MGIVGGKIGIKTKCLTNQNSVSQIPSFPWDWHSVNNDSSFHWVPALSPGTACLPGPGDSDIKLRE